jgi:transcriptional regulator with XRE-family HTH domain
MTGVGPHLRRLRRERGLTLLDVRVAGGPAASVLSRIENGRQAPSDEVRLQLARIYRVGVDELEPGAD